MKQAVFLQGLLSFLIVAFGQPSFAPWLGPISAVIGYALFWRAIRIYPFRLQRFWRAFLWYGAVSLIQLSWMSAIEYQGVYILFVWLALSIWLGAQFGLLSILIPYQKRLTTPRLLAIAALWTLLEWSRYHILCGYSWNLSGLALSNEYAIQCASLFGVLGLSFWVLFVNLLGFRALTKRGIHRYLVWMGAAAVPYIFGLAHISYHEKQMRGGTKAPPFSCVMVQPSLLPAEKVLLHGQIRHFITPYDQWAQILTYVTEQETADLIVMPEAAVPLSSSALYYDRAIVESIFTHFFGAEASQNLPESGEKVSNTFWAQSLANLTRSEVVIGLDHSEEGGASYNSAFHFRPDGSDSERYDKRILMPLAEYLPFKALAPLVKSYGIADFFTPGNEAKLFRGKALLSPSICYEETFPGCVREGRLAGGEILVNLTNDGWYPDSKLPSQHFEHARFRAVENGVALVRACNTGVSGAIDPLGREIATLSPEKKGALHASLFPYTYYTFFLIWGNGGIVTLCVIFLLFFLILKRPLKL